MSPEPSAKEIVELLMTKLSEERNSSGKVYNVYQCPRGELCIAKGKFRFLKGCGYTNPLNHVRTCLAGGSKAELLKIYETTRKEKETNSSFSLLSIFSQEEKALYDYINLIVTQSLSISIVEQPEFRLISKHSVVLSRKKVRETILSLVQVVEETIINELKGTRGALMHDSWTYNRTHYLGIIAVYMKKVSFLMNGIIQSKEELSMPLLSVSPIQHIDNEDDENSGNQSETTEFNSTAHIRQFETVFNFFHQNIHEWAVCQISDNCSLNLCIANIMEIPHVGCLNHKLHLDINDMIDRDYRLLQTIKSIQTTMSDCKSKLKSRALLRNLTDLAPITHNTTRWSGKYDMLKRFNQIRGDLISAAKHENASIRINDSNVFKEQAQKFENMLKYFNIATKELQKQKSSLHSCRCVIDSLLEEIEAKKDDIDSDLYDCKFFPKRVSIKGTLSPSSDFESGVCKIQSDSIGLMTEAEKQACVILSKTRNSSTVCEDSNSKNLSFEQKIARKKRRFEKNTSSYINCDFILGSSAEIERVWSISKYILTDHRKSMEPIIFEALVFLKVNRTYWDRRSVQAALARAKRS